MTGLAPSKSYFRAGFPGWFRGLFVNPFPHHPNPGTMNLSVTTANENMSVTAASLTLSISQ